MWLKTCQVDASSNYSENVRVDHAVIQTEMSSVDKRNMELGVSIVAVCAIHASRAQTLRATLAALAHVRAERPKFSLAHKARVKIAERPQNSGCHMQTKYSHSFSLR